MGLLVCKVGNPLKAAGWGRGQDFRAGLRDQNPDTASSCRAQGDSRSRGSCHCPSGKQRCLRRAWKGATFVSGQLTWWPTGLDRGGREWTGVGRVAGLGTCLWACPGVRSPHPSHRQWPCSCAGAQLPGLQAPFPVRSKSPHAAFWGPQRPQRPQQYSGNNSPGLRRGWPGDEWRQQGSWLNAEKTLL